ncbi:hypothetical protein BKA64DRAFT_649235 [Cadophora sp. MPI-SDFR-AT-0126]|nr:hypothetical protein BKA64DRAFT_649235 [Leotiomycetes sp. MPI-SDFR-AT-0126]
MGLHTEILPPTSTTLLDLLFSASLLHTNHGQQTQLGSLWQANIEMKSLNAGLATAENAHEARNPAPAGDSHFVAGCTSFAECIADNAKTVKVVVGLLFAFMVLFGIGLWHDAFFERPWKDSSP